MDNNIKTTRDYVRQKSDEVVTERLETITKSLEEEGFSVSFGTVGRKTTYCLLSKGEDEYVGFTFIRNLKYLNEKVGKLKALQQSLARKEIIESKVNETEN